MKQADNSLRDLLSPQRLTEVVDIGANPIDGEPPYTAMLSDGLCRVTGFEPQQEALLALQAKKSLGERYLPYAVGDGDAHTLNIFRTRGMTSLLEPDPAAVNLFAGFQPHGRVDSRVDVQTRRLDDITEIEHLDFLKIDVQGSELAVFQSGKAKLADAVAIQTEISFVTLYEDQPSLGEVDRELRAQGFMPHCFAAIKPWPTTSYGADNRSASARTQLLEADVVYIRDIAHPDSLSDEQLKHLALIAHHCYQSFDLAMHCVMVLEQRQALQAGSQAQQRYREILAKKETQAAVIPRIMPYTGTGIESLAAQIEWSAFYLAQTYFDRGDYATARKWYARRIELGGDNDDEMFYAMYRLAWSMHQLYEPWADVQDAYLRAWAYRPTRAESLHSVALQYRKDGRYELGYMFARRAAEISPPEPGNLYVEDSVYAWRAADEQALCAERIGRQHESFAICRKLLSLPDIPEDDRQRIATNRDLSVAAMLDAAATYPDAVIDSLGAADGGADVTVSLVAGEDLAEVERTLNPFLHCCTDVSRVARFLIADTGLSEKDRRALRRRYPFVNFANSDESPADVRTKIRGRLWLHLGRGWRFFAPEDYITRLTAVLDAEPDVVQVGVNFADAHHLTRACAAETTVRRAPGAGRYVLADTVASGPAMFDTARLDRAGGIDVIAVASPRTATLDEVLCIASA